MFLQNSEEGETLPVHPVERYLSSTDLHYLRHFIVGKVLFRFVMLGTSDAIVLFLVLL